MVSLLKCLQIVNCTATNVAEWMISIMQLLFYAVRTFLQEESSLVCIGNSKIACHLSYIIPWLICTEKHKKRASKKGSPLSVIGDIQTVTQNSARRCHNK